MRSYDRYCPVAKALDAIGERWSLLLVHQLMDGPLRFTDLEERLEGIGTNILSARLKKLEADGVLVKRRLKPPFASTVYELTGAGRALRVVIQDLARWGLALLPPPSDEHLTPGWLVQAVRLSVPADECRLPDATIAFRSGEEEATLRIAAGAVRVDGEADPDADAAIAGEPAAYYAWLAERDPSGLELDGDTELLERVLVDLIPQPLPA